MKEDSTLLQTARKAAAISYDTLPQDVAKRAEYAVLDAIINCLASKEAADFVAPLAKLVADAETNQNIKKFTLFGQQALGSKEDAVFYNVAAGSVTARNDHHAAANVHPGSVIVPALLAESEQNKCTGKDFLVAVVVGYEIMIRMGALLQKGTQYPLSDSLRSAMLPAPVGVAFAVSRLYGSTPETMKNAAALACHHYCGVEQWRLAGTAEDNYQNAWDTLSGMHCVRMAKAGVQAADENLDGCYGFLHIFGAEGAADELQKELGETYFIGEVRSKISGACARVLTPLQLAEEFLQDAHFSLDQVSHIKIYVNQKCTTRKWFMNQKIESQSDSINSVAYAVAEVLVKQNVNRVTWFPPFDEKTLQLTEAIELVYDEQVAAHLEPDGYRMEVTMKDGGSIAKEKLAFVPLTQKGIEEKFIATASPLYGKNKAEHLLKRLLSMETVEDVGALVKDFRL